MLSNIPECTAFDKAGRANHKHRLTTGNLRGKRSIGHSRSRGGFCRIVHNKIAEQGRFCSTLGKCWDYSENRPGDSQCRAEGGSCAPSAFGALRLKRRQQAPDAQQLSTHDKPL